jgi:outer membrane biosynthesis protein TonB
VSSRVLRNNATYFYTAAVSREHRVLRAGLRWSVLAHVVFIVFIWFKSLVFPSETKPFTPVLRVDIVDLPSVLKKDLDKLSRKKGSTTVPSEKAEESTAPDIAKKGEMALKSKRTEAEAKKAKAAALKRRREAALRRQKALGKILSEIKDDKKEGSVIPGNLLSKGDSTADDAVVADRPSYLDQLRNQLRANWKLPVWLARQGLSAKIWIKMNAEGFVQEIRFERESGSNRFDEAVKEAVRQSEPLVPPPAKLAEDILDDGIVIGFPL